MKGKSTTYYFCFGVVFLLCSLHFVSCKEAGDSKASKGNLSPLGKDEPLNSNNSGSDTLNIDAKALSWPGVYRGELPCADCGGIHTEINLHRNGNFSRKMTYEGKDGSAFNEKGKINWKTKDIIELNAGNGQPQLYQVENGQLIQLDQAGNKVKGELAEAYILHKD